MSHELVVDLGHSRFKWACAHHGRLLDEGGGGAALADLDKLAEAFDAASPGSTVRVSAQSSPEARAQLASLASRYDLALEIIATGERELAVAPAYDGLGCDRWLAVQWPWQQSRRALIVADCGTALTLDVVDRHGRHRGGWIMAGLHTARAGLLARAPGLEVPDGTHATFNQLPGATGEAIVAGGLLQLAGAIERGARAAQEILAEPLELWLTGGDSHAVKPLIDGTVTHDEHLVLRGLAMTTEAA